MLDLANVVAAALTTRDERAPTARIVELARTGEITTLFSSESLEECREVLLRPRLRKHHSLSEAEVDAVLAGVVAHGIRVEPALDTIEGPDPNDAHLWRMLRMRP
ncbi:MAG TPA: PIN domain-containing protein, partial [Reyranella sp.]|nr:PIN domain-containing protein [Reyranella sp.]